MRLGEVKLYLQIIPLISLYCFWELIIFERLVIFMADGSIIITASIDTDSFFNSLSMLEAALNSFAARFGKSMINESRVMSAAMESAVADTVKTVSSQDWEAAGGSIAAGIAAGISSGSGIINNMLDSVMSVSVSRAVDRYISEFNAATASYTQNIFLKDNQQSPYQVARMIKKQSEEMLRV